jgi:hypothetical protein
MRNYEAPGVYTEERAVGPRTITGVSTSVAGFVGETERGPVTPRLVTSWQDFQNNYGGFDRFTEGDPLAETHLVDAVYGFFKNAGDARCYVGRVVPGETPTSRTGLGAVHPAAGPAPRPDELDADVEDVAFGDVIEGHTAVREVTLTNAGGEDDPVIHITDVQTGGVDAGEFDTDFLTEVTLGPGQSWTLEVQFTPASQDPKSGTVSVLHDAQATASPIDVPLAGTGVAPRPDELDLSTTTIDFGLVDTDESASRAVTYTNAGGTGDATITLSNVRLVDNDSDEFQTDDGGGETALQPGDSLTVEVTFSPVDAGDESAQLQVDRADGTAVPAVDLTGEGSEVTVSTDELDFGGVGVDDDARLTVSVTNRMPDDAADPVLTVSAAPVNGADADEFETDFGDPVDLDSGESLDVEVTFEPEDATPKSARLDVEHDGPNSPTSVDLSGEGGVLTVEAVGPGAWGNRVAVFVTDSARTSEEDPKFDVTLRYWSTDAAAAVARRQDGDPDEQRYPYVEEAFTELSADESSSQYYVDRINAASDLVTVAYNAPGRPGSTDDEPVWLHASFEDVPTEAELADYLGQDRPGNRFGLAALGAERDVSIVCVPDENEIPGLTGEVVSHCERQKDRVAVLQASRNAGELGDMEVPRDSQYAAYYFPHIVTRNPATGGQRTVPPGGHVAGIYARSDARRGVHKAPANEIVDGVEALQFDLTKREHAVLNPKGINVIRPMPGRGLRLMGARTTSSDPMWRYLNVRRLFVYIEQSIEEATQYAVFEPNTPVLWSQIRQSVDAFLRGIWEDNGLFGRTPEEAYYVKCDETTMSRAEIDAGILVTEVGIAPSKPAEFVVFRFAQATADAEAA